MITMVDRVTGTATGFCLCKMLVAENADKVIQDLDGKEFESLVD